MSWYTFSLWFDLYLIQNLFSSLDISWYYTMWFLSAFVYNCKKYVFFVRKFTGFHSSRLGFMSSSSLCAMFILLQISYLHWVGGLMVNLTAAGVKKCWFQACHPPLWGWKFWDWNGWAPTAFLKNITLFWIIRISLL